MSLEEEITARAQARIGSVLRDKWRLDRLLGVGGMAAVYSATHRNGSRAAVKMLHVELSGNAEIKRRFLREGYVANAVEHKGAVRVLDDDTAEDGSVYLVMELLVGRSLEQRLERNGRPLSEDEVVFVAIQLLDVLDAAHAKGVVHRDIKPANVFLTPEGQVKVLDFGIARLRLESDTSSMATSAGTTMGTPAFMSPEQAMGQSDLVDGRTDSFAVGATMFFLLTGRHVHVAQSLNQQLVFAATRPAEPIASLVPGLTPEVAAIIDRSLAFQKTDRFESAGQMRDALRNALASQPESFARGRASRRRALFGLSRPTRRTPTSPPATRRTARQGSSSARRWPPPTSRTSPRRAPTRAASSPIRSARSSSRRPASSPTRRPTGR